MSNNNRVITEAEASTLINAWVEHVGNKPFSVAKGAFFPNGDEDATGCTGVCLDVKEYINLISCIGGTHLCLRFGYNEDSNDIKYCCIGYCVNSKGTVVSPYYLISNHSINANAPSATNDNPGVDGAIPNIVASQWQDDWASIMNDEPMMTKHQEYTKFFHVPGIEGAGKSSVLRGFNYSIAESTDALFSNSIEEGSAVQIINTCHCSVKQGEATFGIMLSVAKVSQEQSESGYTILEAGGGGGHSDLGSPCPNTCP